MDWHSLSRISPNKFLKGGGNAKCQTFQVGKPGRFISEVTSCFFRDCIGNFIGFALGDHKFINVQLTSISPSNPGFIDSTKF